MKRLVSILILLPWCAWATDYDVIAAGGGDYTSIVTAVNAASPGDTIIVHNGTYSGGTITASGSEGSWITITNETGHTPLVNSDFTVAGRSWLRWSGLSFTNASFTKSSPGWAGVTHMQFIDLTFYKKASAVFAWNDEPPASNILWDGLTLIGLTNDFITCRGTSNVLRRTTARDCTDTHDVHMDFLQRSSASTTLGDFGLIEDCMVYEYRGQNAHFYQVNYSGTLTQQPSNHINRHNTVALLGAGALFWDQHNPGDYTGMSVYNHTFYRTHRDAVSESDYTFAIEGADSTSMARNNLWYDTIDRTSADGGQPTGLDVDYGLVYDPDGAVTLDDPLQSATGVVVDQDPGFGDPDNEDFSITTNSPAFNAGGHLTLTAGTGSGSTNLVVDNAYPFQDGWAHTQADKLAVGSVTNVAQISTIDYGTGAITLTSAISWGDNDPVWLYANSSGRRVLYGSAPDIGAFEVIVGEGGGGGGGLPAWAENADGVRLHIRGPGG